MPVLGTGIQGKGGGIALALAVGFAGIELGKSLIEMKKADRVVTVKGLSETEVEADIASWRMPFRGEGESGPGALALVIFEKGWDMLALLVWCLFGLVFLGAEQAIFLVLAAAVALALLTGIALTVSPRAAGHLLRIGGRFAPARLGRWLGVFADSWGEVLKHVWARPGRGATVVLGSVALWFLHLFQIWLFALALAAILPLIENLARAALSILVGLLPFTLAGIGTRDAALIFFYQPHMTAQAAAALGLLCTLRYLLPALAGLPLLGLYVHEIRREA